MAITLKNLKTNETWTSGSNAASGKTITLKNLKTGETWTSNSGTTQSGTTQKSGSTTQTTTAAKKSKYAVAEDGLPTISALGAGSYGADKRIIPEDVSGVKLAADTVKKGVNMTAQGFSSGLAMVEDLLGDFARFGTDGVVDFDTSKWLFNRWNEAIKAEGRGIDESAMQNIGDSKTAKAIYEYGSSAVNAIPQAVLAVLTGGGSEAATATTLAREAAATASPTIANTANVTLRKMASDPNYWTAFSSVVGNGYEQAIEDGQDTETAALYAVGNGLINAAVEVGGGIQTLPKEMQNGTSGWKAWVDSMLDEGKEEVAQGVVERAMQNATYNKGNPLVSVGGEGILDPATAAEEFAGGAVVGGLLGGGQIALNSALNKLNRAAQRTETADAEPVVDATAPVEETVSPVQETAQAAVESLASPTVTQSAAQAETDTPATEKPVQRVTAQNTGFEENGKQAYAQAEQEYGSEVYGGFAAAYNAGLNGESPTVQSNIPAEARSAAYTAGLQDRTAKLAKVNAEVKKVTVTEGAGLIRNDYARKIAEAHPETAKILNSVGKATGARVEIVEDIEGANGFYDRDTKTIYLSANADSPVRIVFAHELTHHLQELSGTEYAAYRQAAVDYLTNRDGAEGFRLRKEAIRQLAKENGMTLSEDGVLDEIAADFTETLLDDAELFERFAKENRTTAQKMLDRLKELVEKIRATLTGKARDKAAQDAYGKDFNELEQIAQKWQAAYDAAVESVKNTETAADGGGVRYSIRRISGDSGKQYGIGVYLDSPLLENLTDAERVQMVKERIRELGGQTFVAYDQNGNAVDVRIAEHGERFTNKSGKSVPVNKDLVTKNRNVAIKQDAVVLVDELISASRYKKSNPARHPHGWLDDNGKNNWAEWNTYIQSEDNSVWNATLHIATATDGTKYLYDVDPIKMVEQPGKSGTSTTNASVAQDGGNVNKKFSFKKADTAYLSTVQSGDTATAQNLVDEAAEAAGYTIHAYHGTARADRVGTVFRPDRATSGPMAFFTSSKEIAENYARDKADTSIAYDTEYDDYYSQFRVTRNGKSLSVGELWSRLTPAERAKIKEAAPHIRFDEDYDQIIYDPTAQHGNGAYDAYELNRNRGNVLNTLVSTWLETGDLYNREADFLDVLKLAGVKDAEYRDPDARNEKVYDTYLKIQNPFDTETVNRAFYNDLSAWLDNTDIDQYQRENSSADMWDKNATTPEKFLERLYDDIERGTTHAWTSIPDYVTAYLQEQGYDGIKDTGGKGGGDSHTVWIPFSSEQVKSAEPVVYDDSGSVIPLSARFNESNPDIRYSMKGTREMLEKYGAIPQGEKAAREVQVPRKTDEDRSASRTVRTVLEAKVTPEEMVPTIEDMVAEGTFSREAYGDRDAVAEAKAQIEADGWDRALRNWFSDVESGKVSKTGTAMGWELYNNAASSGNTKTALDILNAMVEHQRSAAQALQASRILKKLSPETQLYQVSRSVQGLQKELNERYGDKKAPELEIDAEFAKQFMRAKDQATRDKVLESIYRDIGRQMPSRFADKWNAWRYLSMLGNARTHVRNVVGNAGFAPVVMAKNAVATGIESAVGKVSGGKLDRSKAFVGGKKRAALVRAATADYAKIQDTVLGGGKYSDLANANRYVEEGRVIFKSNIPVLKQTARGLEAARKFNSYALDAEDAWFSKPYYANAMAQYCAANNITPEMIEKGQGIAKAREYAIKEAQKATYRDTNTFSQFISELGRGSRNKTGVKKAAAMVVEGILPFRKTPANILVRGIEYSPIGLMNGVRNALVGVQKGTVTAAEAIDSISAGLTGTGLMALGIAAAKAMLVRGHGEDDDNKADYADLTGHQNYALELPNGTSITLDWLAPECLPFFIGVNLYEQLEQNNGELTMAQALQAVTSVTEPLLEMSCLQSLNDVFEAVGYLQNSDVSGLVKALSSAGTSYLTQAIPTLAGQLERTGEDVRYSTYTTKSNPWLTTDMQYAIGKASAKIPGVDYSQIPYIDAWGDKETTGTTWQRALNNLLNPAYVSHVEETAAEKELLRLYNKTGDGSVFPQRADKSFSVNGTTKYLTGNEYVKFATAKGNASKTYINELTKKTEYKKLSDTDKADCVTDLYSLANAKAKQAVSGYKADGWMAKALAAEEEGISAATYVLARQKCSDIESIKDSEGKAISNSKGLQIMEAIYEIDGLTSAQRKILFEDLGVGEKIINYNKAKVAQELNKIR